MKGFRTPLPRSGAFQKRFRKVRVIQIDIESNRIVKIYGSISEAARAVGVSTTCILDCINREQKTSAGYKWERLSEKKRLDSSE